MDSAPQLVVRYQLRACWSMLIGRLTWKSHPLKPLQITTDTSFSILDHASIGCHSRETPFINPGQWDSFEGLIRCPVSHLWLLAIIPDHYVVESHTHFHSSLTSKMLCKVFNAFYFVWHSGLIKFLYQTPFLLNNPVTFRQILSDTLLQLA